MVRRQDSATGRTNDIGQVKKNYIGTPIDHTDTQFYVPVGMCYVHLTTTLVTTPLSHGEPVSCPECSRVIPKTRDVIPLVREGTGYASGGATEAHARGIAFQG